MAIIYNNNLQLDEDERKKIRREKNKVAAMRCRNRRKKRIETLTKVTHQSLHIWNCRFKIFKLKIESKQLSIVT